MDRSYLCYFLLCSITACVPKKNIRKVTIAQGGFSHESHFSKAPPINIWVHGTRFIKRPIFHNFFKSTPGIKLAKNLAPDYYLNKIAVTLNKVAPHTFPLDTFYLFGWSGKLSTAIRREAAEILYREVDRIVAEYKQRYNTDPIIRMLTHSHGGTVALNMARHKKDPLPFHIDELILMACPVQSSTKRFIEDELFKKTIALYSSLDMMQVLAPQVTYNFYRTKKGHLKSHMHWPPFSRRCFEDHPKLAQVKLKMNGRALFHTEFTSQHFTAVLPQILHVVDSWYRSDRSPCGNHLLCVYTKESDVAAA